MLKNSKVEEVLHLSYKNIDEYALNIIKNNLGLNITLLDYRIEESVRNHWRNINPLVQELHLNTAIRSETAHLDEPGLKRAESRTKSVKTIFNNHQLHVI